MFKDDPNGKTHDIYSSWYETVTCSYHNDVRELGEFSLEELNHLKWLIEQEIGVRSNGGSPK